MLSFNKAEVAVLIIYIHVSKSKVIYLSLHLYKPDFILISAKWE